MWSLLTGSLPARTRSFCAQQKQSAIVSRDKTVPIKHENSSQEEERCINCFIAERNDGKGETEQKFSPCFYLQMHTSYKCSAQSQAHHRPTYREGMSPFPVELLVGLELSHSGGFNAARGDDLCGLIYAGLAPDIITSGKAPGQALG